MTSVLSPEAKGAIMWRQMMRLIEMRPLDDEFWESERRETIFDCNREWLKYNEMAKPSKVARE